MTHRRNVLRLHPAPAPGTCTRHLHPAPAPDTCTKLMNQTLPQTQLRIDQYRSRHTIHTASRTMFRDIFDSPSVRS